MKETKDMSNYDRLFEGILKETIGDEWKKITPHLKDSFMNTIYYYDSDEGNYAGMNYSHGSGWSVEDLFLETLGSNSGVNNLKTQSYSWTRNTSHKALDWLRDQWDKYWDTHVGIWNKNGKNVPEKQRREFDVLYGFYEEVSKGRKGYTKIWRKLWASWNGLSNDTLKDIQEKYPEFDEDTPYYDEVSEILGGSPKKSDLQKKKDLTELRKRIRKYVSSGESEKWIQEILGNDEETVKEIRKIKRAYDNLGRR